MWEQICHSTDIIVQKNNENVWRLYNMESGLLELETKITLWSLLFVNSLFSRHQHFLLHIVEACKNRHVH